MPIKVPSKLPAKKQLEIEQVQLISSDTALRQDIRPMRVILLNLMPRKRDTEVQFARLLGNSPLQIELTLMTTASYQPKNEEITYLNEFYYTLDEIDNNFYDALIITGAPVETLPFEEVAYWKELVKIIEWSNTHVFQRIGICWGAQALLYHQFQIPKYTLEDKIFGIFSHQINQAKLSLMQGFTDNFPMPVSRHTETKVSDIRQHSQFDILAFSERAGIGMTINNNNDDFFIFNHLEYDFDTLHKEYERDLNTNQKILVPENYYPENNINKLPTNVWRPFAFLLFANWVNQLYQKTPYDLSTLKNRDI
jgi:homoserine O-succinyltransferase